MPKKKKSLKLTKTQERFLRGLGHERDPIVQIGQKGLTESVVAQVEDALTAHELVKIKLNQNAPLEREKAVSRLTKDTGAILVQKIGRVILLYRPDENEEERSIMLPKK